jgi:hypothetical protein
MASGRGFVYWRLPRFETSSVAKGTKYDASDQLNGAGGQEHLCASQTSTTAISHHWGLPCHHPIPPHQNYCPPGAFQLLAPQIMKR